MSVKWISHRGESADAPENTLASYRLALERNTDGLECDLRVTSDGVVVCSHDGDTSRTGGVPVSIGKTSYAELVRINVSCGKAGFVEHVPRFSDLLALHRKKFIYFVEIKGNDPAVLDTMMNLVRESGVPADAMTVIAFSQTVVRECKKRFPFLTVYWLASKDLPETGAELVSILQSLNADGVDADATLPFIDRDYVSAVKNAGFAFAVWTVDEIALAEKMISCNVDAVTSNRASHLRDQLARRN